ncbi:MAG: ABC transporter permease [Actinomycetota bacterium]|nr:ABC transporter permease [Actinomycetota bacterium]
MIAAFRSEWVKLTRRNFAAGSLAALVGFSVAITSVSILRANDTGIRHGPMGQLTLNKLVAPGGWLAGLGAASTFLGLVTLAIFASNVAGEFTTGTIRSVLTIEPRRLRVLAGKTIALVTFIAAGLVITSAVVAAVAFPLAARQGLDTSAWTTTSALAEGLSTYINVLLSCVAWGVFGAMLAMLTRSSAIAIAAGVGYFLLGEQLLLNSLWPSTEEWLPASAMSALAEGGNTSIGFGAALGLVAAYALGAYVLAAATFARRDITA